MRKNAPASPEGSEAAGKARNPEKRAFSLPYISHNVHYTKLMQSKNQTLHSLPAAAVRKNSEGH